ERGRPPLVPRLAPHAVRRRRRLPGDPRATPPRMSAVARLRTLELSPAGFLRFALTSLAAVWLIVTTGAAVRLTDSGLGCRHWPGCEKGHPLPEKNYHAYIEFGNRLVGGVVIALTLIAWVSARRTRGLPLWARRLALAVFLGP